MSILLLLLFCCDVQVLDYITDAEEDVVNEERQQVLVQCVSSSEEGELEAL